MKKIVQVLLTTILCLSLILSGCDSSKSKDSSSTSSSPKVLTIGAGRTFWLGPTTNAYVHGTTNVWESLVRLNNNMEPEFELSEKMTKSEDGLTWTIKLRKDIKFHDGSKFNAEVAKYNLERMYHFNSVDKKYDPNFNNSAAYGEITSISVVDDYTLEVKHAKPIPDFIERVAYENGAMFSLKSFDSDRKIVTPYGTGPFKYKNYDDKAQILYLEKFSDYRKGTPKIDQVVFKNIPDAATRLAALQNGEIDAVADVGAILPQQASKLSSDSNLELKQRLVSTNHYMLLNCNKGKFFNDVRLRNALSFATNRDQITKNLLEGYGKPAISILSPVGKTWVKDCKYEYDIEKARKLKIEAIGDTKASVVLLLNSSLTGRWPYKDVSLLVQSELTKIGIDVKIETVDSATWSSRLKKGDYDIAPQPYTVSSGEPNTFFVANMLSTGANNKSRSYGIKDTELDDLINKVAVEPQASKRKEYYNSMQDISKDKSYIIPLWHDVTLYAVKKKVKNFDLDITFWPDLYKVSIK